MGDNSSLCVFPTLAQFASTKPTSDEIIQFLHLKHVVIPEDRPYSWSNTVASLDGITSLELLNGEESSSPSLALTGLSKDSETDWALLNAGWAFADAVLGSAEILRNEPNIKWIPNEEMLQFRLKVLQKPTPYPFNIILTSSGIIPENHPIINDVNIPTIIFISPGGLAFLSTKMPEAIKSARENVHLEVDHPMRILHIDKINVTIIEIFSPKKPDSDFSPIDLKLVLKLLRVYFDVKYLDVTAGSSILGSLISQKLLDEYRLTKNTSPIPQTLSLSFYTSSSL
jgi:riboflavin biosynthesis pyrimidine reductase